jgi:CP family cyanate transporter-like MFS transporter
MRGRSDGERPPRPALPFRDRHAWLLTSLFALQGLCYYGFGAWLPDAYLERGWSSSSAGDLAAVLSVAAVPASLLAPRVSQRLGSRWVPLVASGAGLLAATIALAAYPGTAWVAVVVAGVSLGGLFSLCLLLSIDLGRRTHAVPGFAGMMFGLGYTISAAAPIALGAARDAAGSFSTALWLLVAIAGGVVALVVLDRRTFSPVVESDGLG